MNKHNQKMVLVGVLYSGENEYEDSLKSLEQQEYKHKQYFVIENRPNKEAHEILYQNFMENSSKFDIFVKFDADMVFQNEYCLGKIVEILEKNENIDHLEFAVHDWYSDSLIMGLHAFSNRVIWRRNNERLFVDIAPDYLGKRAQIWESPSCVYHSPNPSPFQAYHFGVHRALKVVQKKREIFAIKQAMVQWRILERVWRNFRCKKDIRLGFALLGAMEVFKGNVQEDEYNYTNMSLKDKFNRISGITSVEISSNVNSFWCNPLKRNMIFLKNLKIWNSSLRKKLLSLEDDNK